MAVKSELGSFTKNLRIVYLGNFIDFLEYGLFGALLPFLSQDLLSQYSPAVRAEICYLAIFVGFLGRPVGAFVLGKAGDIYGSNRLMIFSILGISLSSLLLAFLPTNGVYIFQLILLCRFLQGFFTGAEYSAAIVTVTDKKHSYVPVALMISSGLVGISAAQLISFSLSCFNLGASSWRYAFIGVSIGGISLFFKRINLFQKIHSDVPPVTKGDNTHLKDYWKQLVCCVFFVGFVNSMFYLVTSFINNYKMITVAQSTSSQLFLNFVTAAVCPLTVLLWGVILTKKSYNPYSLVKYGLLGIILIIPWLFYVYVESLPLWINILVQTAFMFFVILLALIGITFSPRLFPKKIRVQAYRLGFNLGISLLAGSFPYIGLKLTEVTHNPYMPIFPSLLLAITAFISLRVLKSNYPYVFIADNQKDD